MSGSFKIVPTQASYIFSTSGPQKTQKKGSFRISANYSNAKKIKRYPGSVTGEKPILSFETRSRIVFFQSRASRRERDFVHRISSLETRSRILFTESRASRQDREFCSPNLEIRDEIEIFRSFYQNILVRKKRFFP